MICYEQYKVQYVANIKKTVFCLSNKLKIKEIKNAKNS